MKDFKPELCQCPLCETLLRSQWQGEFRSCECGESFVDQTAYYSRYGGPVKSVDELLLQDLEEITGFYLKDDILSLISQILSNNAIDDTSPEYFYSAPQKLLGGMTMEYLVSVGRGHKVVAFLDAVIQGDLP
jgi:hypothetical protein